MDLKNSIQESLIYRFFKWLGYIASNSKIFNVSFSQEKKLKVGAYKTWINSSLTYRISEKIDTIFQSIERRVHNGIKESRYFNWVVSDSSANKTVGFTSTSIIKKLILRLSQWISFNDILAISVGYYFAIDYVIRKLPVISALGSVWDELYLLMIFAYIILRRIRSAGTIGFNRTSMDLPVVTYFLLGICHVYIRSLDLGVAIEGFRAVFQHILWYFAATQLIRDEDTAEKVVDGAIVLGFLLGLHAIYQYVMKVPMPGNWVDTGENISTRAFSIIGSPNILGVIFVLLIYFAFSKALSTKKTFSRLYYVAAGGAMVMGLLLTMSRGAWLAFAFALAIFTIALVPRLILPLTGLGTVFVLFGGALSERLLYMMSPVYLMKSAAGGRLYRWDIGLELWKKNKFFGVGLGRFGGAVAINNQLAPFYLDNYYLKTLVEMGIFGVAGLVYIIICFVVSSIREISRQTTIKGRIMTIGLFTGASGVLAQNFVENIFEVPGMVVFFWLTVALISAYGRKSSGEENSI